MKEPTIEEVLELVSFERDENDKLKVHKVHGDIFCVRGNIINVEGDVSNAWGDVYYVEGNVRNVIGDVGNKTQ